MNVIMNSDRPTSELEQMDSVPRIATKRKGSAPELGTPIDNSEPRYGFPPGHQIRRPSLPVTPSQYRGPNSPTRLSPLNPIAEDREDSMEDVKKKLQLIIPPSVPSKKVDNGIDDEDMYQNQAMVEAVFKGSNNNLALQDIQCDYRGSADSDDIYDSAVD